MRAWYASMNSSPADWTLDRILSVCFVALAFVKLDFSATGAGVATSCASPSPSRLARPLGPLGALGVRLGHVRDDLGVHDVLAGQLDLGDLDLLVVGQSVVDVGEGGVGVGHDLRCLR
jgi:hypothetical protein